MQNVSKCIALQISLLKENVRIETQVHIKEGRKLRLCICKGWHEWMVGWVDEMYSVKNAVCCIHYGQLIVSNFLSVPTHFFFFFSIRSNFKLIQPPSNKPQVYTLTTGKSFQNMKFTTTEPITFPLICFGVDCVNSVIHSISTRTDQNITLHLHFISFRVKMRRWKKSSNLVVVPFFQKMHCNSPQPKSRVGESRRGCFVDETHFHPVKRNSTWTPIFFLSWVSWVSHNKMEWYWLHYIATRRLLLFKAKTRISWLFLNMYV